MSATASQQIDSWRAVVLDHFSAEIAASCRVTVVADPDGLLFDDEVGAELTNQGFDIVAYRDAIKFRYYYETRHRKYWDRGQHSSLVISVPYEKTSLQNIPNDILIIAESDGRIFEVSLAIVFPTLAVDVLSELDRADLDSIWSIAATMEQERLGRHQTQDLVLRTVFKLSAEMITGEDDLLSQLLRLHYSNRIVPKSLASRFSENIAKIGLAATWPLMDLISSANSFMEFLQERWPLYLQSLGAEINNSPLRYSGPENINFASAEIATVIDNLFQEGRLQPIQISNPQQFDNKWERVGIEGVITGGSTKSVRQLLTKLHLKLPEPNVPPTVWTIFAHRWAKLVRMVDNLKNDDRIAIQDELELIECEVDQRLLEWLQGRIGLLSNRSFLPSPTMVHQVAHFLAHGKTAGDKIALIVVDGMSMSQWLMIKDAAYQEWEADIRLKEDAVFAWIPTVTSISRQAIFSGLVPMFFETSIQSTSAEEKHWKAFWEDRGWRRDRVTLIKHHSNEIETALIARACQVIDNDEVECLGIVMNSLDRLVHGAGPESNVLNASVRQWAANGHLTNLVQLLLNRGFTVAIASDHGNIQAVGIGRPSLGSIPDERGQRAIIFPDSNTMGEVHDEFPKTVQWSGAGLPESMHTLLASGHGAFVGVSGSLHTHGGASIEEVIVPFIQVSKSR